MEWVGGCNGIIVITNEISTFWVGWQEPAISLRKGVDKYVNESR